MFDCLCYVVWVIIAYVSVAVCFACLAGGWICFVWYIIVVGALA